MDLKSRTTIIFTITYPLSFRRSASCCRSKKIIALPPLLSLPQPLYSAGIAVSSNDNNRLTVIADNNVLAKAKKKSDSARLWMRFDRLGQS